MKLRDKILVSYFLLLFFWISVFYYSHQRSTKDFNSYLQSSVTNILDQTESNLSYRMQEMMKLSNQIFFNSDIQTILENDEIIGSPIYTQYGNYLSLYDFISRLSNIYEIYNIRFYLMSRLLYTREEISFYHSDLVRDKDWYQAVLELKGKPYWTFTQDPIPAANQSNYLAQVRVLKNPRGNIENVLGILCLEIKESEVASILERLRTSSNTEVYLSDEDGMIRFSMGQMLSGSYLTEDIISRMTSGSISFYRDTSGERKAVMSKTLINGWSIVTLVPYLDIMRESITRRNNNLAIAIIMSIISIAAIFMMTKSTSRRLEEIAHRMVNTDFTNDTFRFDITNNDEIGLIEEKFNEMMIKIQELLNEVKTVEAKRSKAELITLQSQINPHFLYNIMDTINWMAVKHKAFNISKVVSLLGQLLRVSLVRDSETAPVKAELEHVKLYVAIEKIRFKDSFDVTFDIDPDLHEHQILRTIIQPVVENSIKHGMRQNNTKDGKINVCVKKDSDQLQITITDNGPQINGTHMRDTQPNGFLSGGYGLSNIRDRLDLYYGDRAKLSFKTDSEITIVMITLPVV